ncbi:MAG: AraC family transcriptional regulator [Spirochaetota bacterium]
MDSPWTGFSGKWMMIKKIQHPLFANIIDRVTISVLVHGHYYGERDWGFTDDHVAYDRLYFVLNGKGWLSHGKQKIPLSKGNIYLIPVNTSYTAGTDSTIEKFYIHFRFELYPGKDVFDDLGEVRSMPIDDMSRLRGMIALTGRKKLGDIMRVKAFLLSSLAGFADIDIDSLARDAAIAERYRALFSHLEHGAFDTLSIGSIARAMGMSVSGLSRAFFRDTGETIRAYRDRKLMRRAKDLLVLTARSVKDVARELGFNDEFYFSRYFKKQTGFSPADYRVRNAVR